jgi:hypothetical protein
MDAAIDLRTAQQIFEENYPALVDRAARALANRIRARPRDRDELIQNTLAHTWAAWWNACKAGNFHGMPPAHRLRRLVVWQAKLRRVFGHQYRNRWSWHDASHGCMPIEEVLQPAHDLQGQDAVTNGQSMEQRMLVAIGEVETNYRKTR